MARIRLKYVTADLDRYGNVRYYFRRPGQPKIRLRGQPGSKEFNKAYEDALAQKPAADPQADKSLDWLCEQYFRSPEFKRLGTSTQPVRRSCLHKVCDTPISDSNPRRIGTLPFASVPKRKIRELRDQIAHTPEAANQRLKALKVMFGWAVKAEHMDVNPAAGVEKFQSNSEGFHTWTVDEVRLYEAKHPIGTRARLALALLLYTGQRRSDIVRFGPQHVKNGWLKFTQAKNAKRKPVELTIPVLPELQRIIDATPTGHLAFLVTSYGKPHGAMGFSRTFRKWCDEAGLPTKCSAHGLRKAGAAIAAENGATANELNAIFGWQTMDQSLVYTKRAEQKKMAGNAMSKLVMSDE